MSVLLEKTAEPQIQSRVKPGFHLFMACACSVLLLATLFACKRASLRLPNPLSLTIGLVFVSAVVFVVTISGFRFLRIPAALLSGMIVVSTVTTGWHYVIDVAAGIAVACLSLAIANVCLHNSDSCSQRLGAVARP